MRHLKKRKIGRGVDQRRKLLKSLASSIVLYERIETSFSNARAVKSYLEKAITQSENNSLHVRRLLLSKLTPMAAKKLLEVLGPKYKDRKGGYSRLIKLNDPHKDKSRTILELVE